MTRRKLDDLLASIGAIRADPSGPEALPVLRAALAQGGGALVAAAAHVVGDAGMEALYPDLRAAFERLRIDGVSRDPGCRGKQAIADALLKNEVYAEDVFLPGVRHVQREPVWGGSVDTAPGLRGTCALGLAMMDHRDALDKFATLLADPEANARANAAVALGNLGRAEAVPLLRYKCLLGDEAPEVVGEAMSALLSLRPDSLEFIASFLDAPRESVIESALLALGQTRRAEVLPILRDYAQRARPGVLRTALLALGLLRSEASTAFLLGWLAEAPPAQAVHALDALAIQSHDPALSARVRQVVGARRSRPLDEALARAFAR